MHVFHPNAMQVLRSRYLRKVGGGEYVETPDEMFRRVAQAVAKAELNYTTQEEADEWAAKFFKVMDDMLFLPNSPTLMNAGRPNGQLSACFVLPVEDSLDEIFSTLKSAAKIQQHGGGTGFNFSALRPEGSPVKTAGGQSSGIVGFMKIFDATTENIRQGGTRRGANMGILRVDHPDILNFIYAKGEQQELRNFNLSVAVTDAFMEAVENDGNFELRHPAWGDHTIAVEARKLWSEIVMRAWKTGDPGLVFLDEINRRNAEMKLPGPIAATNPCGEMPLLPYESCNLGSVNLSKMVRVEGEKREVDWDLLKRTVHLAVRFLDDVIDVNGYVLPEIEAVTKGNRKIGLGVMGWAEMLIRLQLPYDSAGAMELADELMAFIQTEAAVASEALARERGPYPNWAKADHNGHAPVRNATRTSIAPTGTISMIAGTSSGIEPLFALAFKRAHILDGETLCEVNRLLIEELKARGLFSDEILQEIMQTGTLENMEEIPEDVQALFSTALDIPWEIHVEHQAAFQRHTENAVSKTINLPENATLEDVAAAFTMAWQEGCKGITVYRYGSKGKQVLNKGLTPEQALHAVDDSDLADCKRCGD